MYFKARNKWESIWTKIVEAKVWKSKKYKLLAVEIELNLKVY